MSYDDIVDDAERIINEQEPQRALGFLLSGTVSTVDEGRIKLTVILTVHPAACTVIARLPSSSVSHI
ncbi:hypothetical protein [Aromatoleum bremense]|uniref:MIP18 family-like domain-containing protein n=1 Tax=Aromatoleum bremense TaxID=76115 RepID=A0ABX1NTR3_9RHOO|nr:hypothetical protein [Aromatoleum bremense]NMG15405.1 hypothetical protein [Aromatoleum bremense]